MTDRAMVAATAAAMLFVVATSASAQGPARSGAGGSRTIEGNVGFGFTAVTAEEWANHSLVDSNAANFQAAMLVLPARSGRVSAGGEIGYQRFFRYEEPGPLSAIYFGSYDPAQYAVRHTAVRLLGTVRVQGNSGFFLDVGAGVYAFDRSTCFGLAGAAGYAIRLGERLSLPVKGRFDYVFDSPNSNIPALAIVAGLGYRF